MKKKKIIVGATGASGMPILTECLKIIKKESEYESVLIMSKSAVLTLEHETNDKKEQIESLADEVFAPEQIGAGPASGSYKANGMLIVPCSMKTAAGICSGYTDI